MEVEQLSLALDGRNVSSKLTFETQLVAFGSNDNVNFKGNRSPLLPNSLPDIKRY